MYKVTTIAVYGDPSYLEKELNKIDGTIISVSFVGMNSISQRLYTVVYTPF